MPHVADTEALIADGVLSDAQAEIIRSRSRALMMGLGINTILCAGILAATGGFIVWLGTPLSVTLTGVPLLLIGLAILLRGSPLYRMFGHAATLIGGGMLLGGGVVELLDKFDYGAEMVIVLGGLVALAAGVFRDRLPEVLRVPLGAALVAGAAAHLVGLYEWAEIVDLSRWLSPGLHFYAALLTAFVGWRVDVRLVTALAIIPFAQVLDTGTAYWHAAYVFYSPESTMTIIQMALFAGLALWAAPKMAARESRHALILVIMAMVVANLAFLVGTLWGDTPGARFFGPIYDDYRPDWQAYREARRAFTAPLIHITEELYTVVYAALLAGAVFWSAHKANRAMFNTAMTFGGIHAYTQMFETFHDEPLAYVVGGLAAVPLAWGLWRLNQRWEDPAMQPAV